MSNAEIQNNILKAVDKMVEMRLKKSKKTTSKIGLVLEEPEGYKVRVSINGNTYSCHLPEHLHTWIQKDDIVIIQDLYDNGKQKMVTGKTGERHESPSLVFYDEETGRNISGRDGVFDEKGRLDTYGTIGE